MYIALSSILGYVLVLVYLPAFAYYSWYMYVRTSNSGEIEIEQNMKQPADEQIHA